MGEAGESHALAAHVHITAHTVCSLQPTPSTQSEEPVPEFVALLTANVTIHAHAGLAGVGAPDDTYAVICEPSPGTNLDPHDIQPWSKS